MSISNNFDRPASGSLPHGMLTTGLPSWKTHPRSPRSVEKSCCEAKTKALCILLFLSIATVIWGALSEDEKRTPMISTGSIVGGLSLFALLCKACEGVKIQGRPRSHQPTSSVDISDPLSDGLREIGELSLPPTAFSTPRSSVSTAGSVPQTPHGAPKTPKALSKSPRTSGHQPTEPGSPKAKALSSTPRTSENQAASAPTTPKAQASSRPSEHRVTFAPPHTQVLSTSPRPSEHEAISISITSKTKVLSSSPKTSEHEAASAPTTPKAQTSSTPSEHRVTFAPKTLKTEDLDSQA